MHAAVKIFFTESDFQANEFDPNNPISEMPVAVTKDTRIATPIVLHVIPLTIAQAMANMSPPLPDNIPGNNPFSPPFAGNAINILCIFDILSIIIYISDLADFDDAMVRVIFDPDEDMDNSVQNAPIPVVDDLINEAEQVFVVQLKLNSSTNPGSVSLTQRPASLCRIVDNDRK